MDSTGRLGRIHPSPFHLVRPPRAPALVFVQFQNELSSHEELLNTMLQQALASVLEAENGLTNALQDLFLASLNLDASIQAARHPTSPKTSTTFLNMLQDHWWSQLPAESKSCNTDCSICLSDFAPSDLVVNLPCHHTFHSACVRPWLEEHNVCPTCRFALPTDDNAAEPKHQVQVDEMLQTEPEPESIVRAPEPVDSLSDSLPGSVLAAADPQEALLESEASALVEDDNMEELVDEILDEMMEVEATSVVQQVQRQRQRMLEVERMLDEAIANDTVE